MDDHEVLHTPVDKQAPGEGLPKHRAVRRTQNPGRAILWSNHKVVHSPEPVFGSYPRGFLDFGLGQLGSSHRRTLHVCSGGLSSDNVGGGVRVDIAMRARPDVLADGRSLPFVDGAFDGVLIDPPYSVEYAQSLYGTDYPRPSHLLREAARVVRAGGRVGFVHFLVPHPPPGMSIVNIVGVTQGCGYRIRALTVFQKELTWFP